MDHATNHDRDKRLRAKILMVLFHVRSNSPTGRIAGRQLKKQVEDLVGELDGFEHDGHALALMRDLDGAGLAEERISKLRDGQRFTLDHVDYAITTAGIALHTEESVKHPLVWDGRSDEND